jgi:glycolate oxidase FAD binding subunit
MSRAAALQRLQDELGPAFELHAPVSVDGVDVAATVRPADGAALCSALEAISRLGLAVVPRGAGTRLSLGNPPARADAFLSTLSLRGVDEFEPGEGVCHALAGTPVGELRERIQPHGWEVPLDVPDESTLGGAVASAAVGPRCQGLGRPRDVVLGLEVALASGVRTRCGGRVVKNVTGYDLQKLYTGSLGSLGVIEGAWLRLRPSPDRVLQLETPPASEGDACRAGIAASRVAAVRAFALVGDGTPFLRSVIELAGDAASVDAEALRLAKTLGAREVAADALDRVRDRQVAPETAGALRFRLAVLPTRLASSIAALRQAGARVLAYPGLGLVYAIFAANVADAPEAALAAFGAAARISREASGELLCEEAPPAAKLGRDVFGETVSQLPLARALKARFDPDGVLSPGRFVGGV